MKRRNLPLFGGFTSKGGLILNTCLYTFHDAWFRWLQGDKFPVAFYGDSTVDGVNTTGWEANVVGVDRSSQNAFPRILEGLLREAAGNDRLRIYNAGFSGQISSWGVTAMESLFAETSPYGDARMIGIGFGINDRLMYPNEKAYRDGFKENIRTMIEWCYSKHIQPFLLTTQAILQPGVMTVYENEYPMRTSGHIETVANEVKRELANEYGLPFIDINRYTERFLQHSAHSVPSIISDRLHFGDIGHQYEAELIFSRFCPRVREVDDHTKIGYSSQKIWDCVPEDWLTMPEKPADDFKVFVDFEKADPSDQKIMTAQVFVNSDKPLVLKAYKGTPSSLTYIKWNGNLLSLPGEETVIGRLDMGLHKLEVFTGASAHVDFKGFILEKN